LETLEQIRAALDQLVADLGLAEEEPQAVFDPQLLVSAAELEDAVCRSFSARLVQRVVALRLSLKALVVESSPDVFARALNSLTHLVEEMAAELASQPEGRAWHLCRQFHDVARHLASPSSAENQSFRKLPEMLYTSSWLQREVGRQLSTSGLSLPSHLRGKEFRKSRTQKWLDDVNRSPTGALATRLDALRGDIEFRARQIWYLLRSTEQDADLPSIYAWAHEDLFPRHRIGLSNLRLAAQVAQLRSLMLSLNLPDIALCLETAEWLSQYAMNYLMPPAPNEWAVEHRAHVTRVLHGRLSRWYFYPFSHRLEPIEMISSVLRVGRPLFYERSVAHAILEYSLLQGITLSRPDAAAYLEILAGLEREFLILFDGYLLRQLRYPRLRTPEGWCEYLDDLTCLHFRNSDGLSELAGYRSTFLAERGLRSPIEILYRISQAHAPVN
jgi:hypothetical protein